MASRVIIIPPDDAPNNDVFNYTLSLDAKPMEIHASILLKYCDEYNINENTVITLPNIEYVVIYTVDNEYLVYCPYNLSERQLLYIKELFEKEVLTAHIGFIHDNELLEKAKAKNFDEFMLSYNNLIKEEKEYVR